jgi:hypothetical protein
MTNNGAKIGFSLTLWANATNSSTNTHFSTPKRDTPEDDKTLIFVQ